MRFVLLLLIGCSDDGSTGAAGDDDDDNGTSADVLSEEDFREDFAAQVCEVFDACFAEGEVCDGSLPEFEDCEYNPVSAASCLDGEFVCNAEFGPGYEFVEQPLICHDVWACPTTSP